MYLQVESLKDNMNETFSTSKKNMEVMKLQSNYWTSIDTLKDFLITADELKYDAFGEISYKSITQEEKLIKLTKNKEAREHLKKLQSLHISFTKLVNEKMVPLVRTGESVKALNLYSKEIKPKALQSMEELKTYLDLHKKEMEKINDVSAKKANLVKNLTIIIGIIIILLGILISVSASRAIIRPLKRLSTEVKLVAGGDLTKKINLKSKDELGDLAAAFNEMIDNFKQILGSIKDYSLNLSTQSEEMFSATGQVSSNMSKITSNANDVTTAVQQTSQNAQDAADKSQEMYSSAEYGGQAVDETVQKIRDIDTASHDVADKLHEMEDKLTKVNEITDTITGIAEQTNLLALNAAVEAARAGEHGKSFAVVADEVRSLAEQSAEAVKGVESIITEIRQGMFALNNSMKASTEIVKQGVSTAEDAGKTINDIVCLIKENVSLIYEISQMAQKSSSSIENLASSSEHINSTMQQVTTFSKELARMSEELSRLTTRFKL